jgi:hypothetical protein
LGVFLLFIWARAHFCCRAAALIWGGTRFNE